MPAPKKPRPTPAKALAPKEAPTSWGPAADWYGAYIEGEEDSYQRQVILPNLLRVLNIQDTDTVLDLACGQGFFAREMQKAGARVTGIDTSVELIKQARALSGDTVRYYVAAAHKLPMIHTDSMNAVVVVLAIQNIENLADVLAEINRVLAPGGKVVLVLMHPAFRVPKQSSWGFDEVVKMQYRRVDAYLSMRKETLLVHPGKADSPKTISYHRSLQDYMKTFAKAGFAITRLEEWISHKQSQAGPRQETEDTARKEIPLFMMLELKRM